MSTDDFLSIAFILKIDQYLFRENANIHEIAVSIHAGVKSY